MDQGLATALAALATVLVGIAVLIATVVTNRHSARTAFSSQLAAERNRGLLELVQTIQTRSTRMNDRIFNVTVARNIYSEDPDRVMGPDRRELIPVSSADSARALALLTVYGTWDIRLAYVAWEETQRTLEDLMEVAAFNANENREEAVAEEFSVAQLHETAAVTKLGHIIAAEMASIPSSSRKVLSKK